jgi:hypothetical protein
MSRWPGRRQRGLVIWGTPTVQIGTGDRDPVFFPCGGATRDDEGAGQRGR